LDQLASGTVKTQELWDDQEFLGHAWELTRVLHAIGLYRSTPIRFFIAKRGK
jgi:hypothetical protein